MRLRWRWPLLAILCVLASLLVPGIASASAAAGAETRVWAFDFADQVRIGVERSPTLEQRLGCEPTYDQLASDSLLAARGETSYFRLWARPPRESSPEAWDYRMRRPEQ